MQNQNNTPLEGTDIELSQGAAHELDSVATGLPDQTAIESLAPRPAWASENRTVPTIEGILRAARQQGEMTTGGLIEGEVG